MKGYLHRYIENAVTTDFQRKKVRPPEVTAVQVHRGGGRDRIDRDGIRICPAHRFLAELV